ncbi:MAG: acyl-CoA dehydrogenase [Pseudonocardiaceae bacterium]|nr:acyl-CoA dehydrogenase [Pseudonocardiaceae bacterium]
MTSRLAGLTLDDEQRDLIAVLDQFRAEHLAAGPGEVSAARDQLVQWGLWVIGAPTVVGGGGADPRTTLLAVHRLAGAFPALALACVHAHAASLVLAAHQRWRVRGERACTGVPVAVVDGRGADLCWDPERELLRGVIDRVDAGEDEPLLVVLEPPQHDGLVVLASSPGEALFGPPQRQTGLLGAHTRSVRLTGEYIVDSEPDMPTVAARAVFRLGCAAIACGIAESALERATDYARQRVQFDTPLIEMSAVRSQLADAELRVRRCTHALFGLAAEADVLEPARAGDVAGTLRSATSDAIEVATAAVQVHGGYGYLTEYRVEGLLRDAVSLRAASAAFAAGHELA